jgi:uncharacterized repeat protein (TIGR03803 family)
MKKVQEPTSRIPWQPLIGLIAVIVLMSMVVPSRAQLHHVPPAAPSFTVLHTFAGSPTDGAYPVAGLLRDAAGNLYGTTFYGGAESSRGVVFKVSPTGTETVLHSFTGADGQEPRADLIRDAAGNLYGTTARGGTFGNGVVFELTPTGTETVLYSFTGGADGGGPLAGLVRDAAGNLYGTTSGGGAESSRGVVFKVSPTGTETVLHSFAGHSTDGADPQAGLVRDSAGNLYGTTFYGGAADGGTVFKLSSCGSGFKVLYSFTGDTDGENPVAGLIQDAGGNLYGTTFNGGAYGYGVVFKLSPTGSETVLYTFTEGNGGSPVSGLLQDAAGNLYGTTTGLRASGENTGVVFKLSPSGTETVLHSFTGGADGGQPTAGLIQDPAGNLYSTTSAGGASGDGVVFRLTP